MWTLLVPVLFLCVEPALGQRSVCSTLQYRSLTAELQNEHQCMVLENLQEEFEKEMKSLKEQNMNIYNLIGKFQSNIMNEIVSSKNQRGDGGKSSTGMMDIPSVRDCHEMYSNGITVSGVYPILLPDRKVINVWCDMDTDNGGWTVIQRRKDGSVNFARRWNDYAFGFGNVNSEYWLGNENIHKITTKNDYSLRVDLWDWEGNQAYALYGSFSIDDERKSYTLHIKDYTGTAGDAMSQYHDGMKFSTVDRDNDEWHASCALKDQSGWWFRACGYASLNGLYVNGGNIDIAPDGLIKGIIWFNWKKAYGYSMKAVEIKIKPRSAVQFDLERRKKLEEEGVKEVWVGGGNDDDDDEDAVAETTVAPSTTPALKPWDKIKERLKIMAEEKAKEENSDVDEYDMYDLSDFYNYE